MRSLASLAAMAVVLPVCFAVGAPAAAQSPGSGGSGGSGSSAHTTHHAKRRHTSKSSAATSPSSSTSSKSTPAEQVKVNDFMSYDPEAKTVTLSVNTARGSFNGGFNFNGGANGDQTIIIPVGWKVSWGFTNLDAIPHSAIIIPAQQPFPELPQTPAIPRAYTAHVSDGLATNATDQTSFTTTAPGHFALVCGVPGHAPSGMWIHFDVDADAKVPGYSMPK